MNADTKKVMRKKVRWWDKIFLNRLVKKYESEEMRKKRIIEYLSLLNGYDREKIRRLIEKVRAGDGYLHFEDIKAIIGEEKKNYEVLDEIAHGMKVFDAFRRQIDIKFNDDLILRIYEPGASTKKVQLAIIRGEKRHVVRVIDVGKGRVGKNFGQEVKKRWKNVRIEEYVGVDLDHLEDVAKNERAERRLLGFPKKYFGIYYATSNVTYKQGTRELVVIDEY